MSTDGQVSGVIAAIDEGLSSAAGVLRSFWNRFSGDTPATLPSGIASDVRETDLTKFLALMQTQVDEEQLTLAGKWTDRKGEIERKLLTQDFDGAEPLMIALSNDIKEAIGSKRQWAKVASSFAETKVAADELFDTWKAPEALGTKGLKGRVDAIAQQVLDQEYAGAVSSYDELTRAPVSAQTLLALYPDRKLWDELSDTFDQAVDRCKALKGFAAPEHDALSLQLDQLRQQASPETKEYSTAAAALPAVAKRIEDLHGLYPGRGDWASIKSRNLIIVQRWLNDLNGWTAPEGEEFSKELGSIKLQATDVAKQYGAAVLAFRTFFDKVDLVHRYWSKLRAIETQFTEVLQQQPDNAGALRAAMVMATELGENKKYVEAQGVLERLKGLLKVALLSNNDLHYLASHVASLRIAGENGLQLIESKLRQQNQVEANRVADILKGLAAGLPTGLETKLRELDDAEEDAVAGLKTAVKTAAQDWLNFLATNKKSLDACTANPFKVPFQLAGPITATVKSVLNQVI